jgi:hypothetical protein
MRRAPCTMVALFCLLAPRVGLRRVRVGAVSNEHRRETDRRGQMGTDRTSLMRRLVRWPSETG